MRVWNFLNCDEIKFIPAVAEVRYIPVRLVVQMLDAEAEREHNRVGMRGAVLGAQRHREHCGLGGIPDERVNAVCAVDDAQGQPAVVIGVVIGAGRDCSGDHWIGRGRWRWGEGELAYQVALEAPQPLFALEAQQPS